ncbi:MFS transporter [Microbacterium sp. BK668]|uniref:MFS transporter n=1 Tax=Microbacterium sp. BK668 TaxID=2512118 RepID=UPI00105E58C7|nr:MFS transporter [Microbacterium sp. BK668]TDN91251.1 CP family cyanate transporter-like MFS transporter [Microbacterium sp. BK668]
MGEGKRAPAIAGLLVATCLVAANMRPTITAVGPLLGQIGDETSLSPTLLGLLGAVPLLMWALVSPVAHELSRRFGMSRAVTWSLVVLAVGTVVRSIPGPTASLWIGTIIIGAALAIVNVLMPAAIKRDFPARVPAMMAVYTALLGGVGAIASGVAVPVSHLELPGGEAGWRFALLVIGLALLPFAIGAWGWATRGAPHAAGSGRHRGRTGIWSDPVAWVVAAYMGFQASTFYMLLTWLASISVSTGRSAVVAGFDVMIYQIFSLAGSLIVPFVLRGRVERFVPALIPTLGIVGVLGLMAAPGAIVFWVVLIGLSSGASLGMTLTLMAQRARDHDASAALSGMGQSVGYVLAALGPVLFGWVHAAVGGWVAPLVLVLVVMIGQLATGVLAGRDRFVLERR